MTVDINDELAEYVAKLRKEGEMQDANERDLGCSEYGGFAGQTMLGIADDIEEIIFRYPGANA